MSHIMDPRAAELVRHLRLEPHPEGGFFREVFRSALRVRPSDDRSDRAALTAIYFLLAEGMHSRWHSVRSDEVWHYYEGAPLELLIGPPNAAAVQRLVLGPVDVQVTDAPDEVRPVRTVPAGWWQAARSLGAYTLVGCTVAPGFEFADFRLFADDPEIRARLKEALETPSK